VLALPLSKLKDLFRGRLIAYNRVFEKDSPFTDVVLRDLAKFCRAHESTFHTDPRVASMIDGRRQVWLRIMENLKLTEDQIYKLHKINDELIQQQGERK
jgi:hypothetical protein